MRDTDLMDNKPVDPNCNDCDSMPDKGTGTGVTDDYGGGLDKGYQSPSKITGETTEYVGFA